MRKLFLALVLSVFPVLPIFDSAIAIRVQGEIIEDNDILLNYPGAPIKTAGAMLAPAAISAD